MACQIPLKCVLIWKLEKFSCCFRGNGFSICSPLYVPESLCGTKWQLEIYPNGVDEYNEGYVACYLNRLEDDGLFTNRLYIDYSLQLISGDEKVLAIFNEKEKLFDGGDSKGCGELLRLDEIDDVSQNWKHDVLTVQCYIAIASETKIATAFTASSIFSDDNYNFTWKVKYNDDDSVVLLSQTKKFCIGDLMFRTELSPSTDDNIVMDIRQEEFRYLELYFFNCKIRALDRQETEILLFSGSQMFSSDTMSWRITLSKTFDQLRPLSTNDELELLCHLSVTFKTTNQIPPNPVSYDSPPVDSISNLQKDMQKFYESREHTDVILRMGDQDFPAHKSILIARSPVFLAMLNLIMSETQTRIVTVQDVDPKTLKSFLGYIYTETVEVINRENAIKLLIIAKTYQVESLFEKCSSFLTQLISQENVCELFSVADTVNDKCLKSACIDYIKDHAQTILASPEWLRWTKKNPTLTVELFAEVASNMINQSMNV